MPDPSSIPALPPLYVQPIPLETAKHATWRLKSGDAAFAAGLGSIPVTASEFMAAGRGYPIVFAGAELTPVAVVGLEGANLFVEDGVWADGAYVPAYVRRYPFVLIEAPDKQSFALGVDAASPRLAQNGAEGMALFEDGQPAEATKQALEFCRLFNADHQVTRAFAKALDEAGVLVERRADVSLPDGRRFGVGGFKVIDPAPFMALADETIAAWHKAGWLALAHHHLTSLDNFQALLQRQGRVQVDQAANTQTEAADPPPVLQ